MKKSALLSLLLLASTAAVAQQRPASDRPALPDRAAGRGDRAAGDKMKDRADREAADGAALAPVQEREVVTAHSVTAHGQTMKYHATAGTLTIRDDDGKPTASVFYVAYTLDGADHRTRPVTYFYNGGPGSSSLWLHMGSFAPVRVQTANPESIRPAPYGFGPNPDTLLDKTDMVFLDMVGSGYSRPLGDAKGKDFWGVDEDVDSFAKAIMRWSTRNSRWTSPKFIFGESYGTTRSGALAYQLEDRGFALNGVVLLSSILNYGMRQPGYDTIYTTYLPSYAAVAWYHNRIQNRPAEIEPFLAEVRAFARGPYTAALAKGDAIGEAELTSVATQMAAYTGLSVDFIRRAKLRVDLSRFRKELLRDRSLTIGRYDGRYTGIDVDSAGESPEFDASDTAISGAFITTFSDYIQRDLNYRTDMPYHVSAGSLKGFEWNWKHRAPGQRGTQTTPDTAVDLGAAMRINPYLKLLSLNGWFDMATPFFGTEYDVAHMLLEPAQRANVQFRYYPSGHMAYLNPEALRQLHGDLATYYDQTIASAASGRPGR